jgi:formylglycine-generating enzyme required for sulfatase activity/energy-coupling factor transporter ATP-binding protein EcfA2
MAGIILMTPKIPPDLLPRTRQILLPLVETEDDREALLTDAFYTLSDSRIYHQIKREGTPVGFTTRCIKKLLDYGCLTEGNHALGQLLSVSKYYCGVDKHANIEELVAITKSWCIEIDTVNPTQKPATKPITDKPITIDTPQSDRKPTVFISYSHKDGKIAERLIADLNQAGHACWLDIVKIKGGDEWVKSITEGINNSYAFLSLVSQTANDSTWVRREFLWAEHKKKKIYPIMVSECELTIYLMERQVLDFHTSYETGLANLLSVLPSSTTPIIKDENEDEAIEDVLISVPHIINRRRLELDYLETLGAEVLFDLEKYTPLGGESQFLVQVQTDQSLELAFMKPEFEHLRQADEHHTETRIFTNAVDEILHIKRAILLGEPGAGKSTTLLSLAGQLANEAHDNLDAPIPLFVRLGRWTKADQSLFDFIAQELGALGEHLQVLIDEGRAVPLLDGMNEIPVSQRKDKYQEIKKFISQHPDWIAMASCREQDYTNVIDLQLDRITVTPLDPLRIREFVLRYLGEEHGLKLFWRIAGEGADKFEARFKEKFADGVGQWEQVFWLNANLPSEIEWGRDFYNTFYYGWDNWLAVRDHKGSLLQLSQNPYMLAMLTQVYVALGDLPTNRGELFKEFIQMLLVREKLATRNPDKTITMTDTANQLLTGLEAIAYEMQVQRGQSNDGNAVTVLSTDVAEGYLPDNLMYWAGSTSILSIGDNIRFTHQLLQEYFAARALDKRIFQNDNPLQASDIWTPNKWWQRTNWEEAVILLAGLYSDDCSKVVQWVNQANPEVAALCVINSGASLADATKTKLQKEWIHRLTDTNSDPELKARVAIGRALGITDWDNRKGVNVILRDGIDLPDIDWVTIPSGEFIYQDAESITLPEFEMSRYPITYIQFQSFIEDKTGFNDARWWEGLAYPTGHNDASGNQAFEYWNHPRERVSWYDAMAFCRWFSWRLGGTYDLDNVEDWLVRLPTEYEWEKATRGTDGREYPYEGKFDASKGNTSETGIKQTSAVGIFANGASPYGILDMSGNVREWCLTDYSNSINKTNRIYTNSASRVLRGGSFAYGDHYARAARRRLNVPNARYDDSGFRVVRPPSL